MNYLEPDIEPREVNSLSVLALAHVGDCVYELMARTYLASSGHASVIDLHKATVSIVNAGFQARAAAKIIPMLSDDEAAVFRRGRNARVNSVPARSTVAEYHAATGLETLFGWLFLNGGKDRLNELFEEIMNGC